jgi:hypothetical protein
VSGVNWISWDELKAHTLRRQDKTVQWKTLSRDCEVGFKGTDDKMLNDDRKILTYALSLNRHLSTKYNGVPKSTKHCAGR